ncbi:hypothetical protein [Gymnodinialimonas sp.]
MDITFKDLLTGRTELYADPNASPLPDALRQSDSAAFERHPDCTVFIRDSPPGEVPLFDALRASKVENVRFLMAVYRGEGEGSRTLNPILEAGIFRLAFALVPALQNDAPHLVDLEVSKLLKSEELKHLLN